MDDIFCGSGQFFRAACIACVVVTAAVVAVAMSGSANVG
jgi:hypothetical protein